MRSDVFFQILGHTRERRPPGVRILCVRSGRGHASRPEPGQGCRIATDQLSPGARAPIPLVSTLLVALLGLIWGSTWLVIRQGLLDLPPFSEAAPRFVIAWVLIVLVLKPPRPREQGAGVTCRARPSRIGVITPTARQRLRPS